MKGLRSRMMVLVGSAAILCGVAAAGGAPRFVFETGEPAWAGESISLPPGFAPELGWKGVEEIRFAPGMFDAGAEMFFTYVLVFLLEEGADVGEEGLERELLEYYRGLARSVMGARGMEVDAGGFELELGRVEEGEGVLAPEGVEGAVEYRGTLDWVEPFETQKAQRLHLELHVWEHGGRPAVLSCVSPVEPDEGAIWGKLREIRGAFRFEG